MAISKEQPMRPALIDVVDDYDRLQSDLEDTNAVVGQLNSELATEIERAMAAEQANALAVSNLAQDFAAFPILEYGAQNSIEVLADDSTTASITFNEAKESAPYLLVSVETTENETEADCHGIITEVTNEGFEVRVQNKDALNTIEATIYWLAIGE